MHGLTPQSCVHELKSMVAELTGIPCDVQKILVGYPPCSLDLQNGDAHLKDYPIKSGILQTSNKCSMHEQVSHCWLFVTFYYMYSNFSARRGIAVGTELLFLCQFV